MKPGTPLPYQRPCASRSTSTRRCTTTGTSSPRSPTPLRRRAALRAPVHVGDRPPAARAAEGDRRGDPQRRARPQRRALPGRGRDDHALARRRATSSTSPATARPTPRRTPPSGWSDRPPATTSCYCSYDKITRCVELEIDVLIDDSPVNLAARVRSGYHRRHARAPVEPGRCLRTSISAPATGRRCAQRLEPRSRREGTRARPARPPRATCPRSSPSARSPTGAAPSASRACSTRRSTTSSTTTGSGSRSRGSSTSRPPAAPCWSPTTPARSRPTRR